MPIFSVVWTESKKRHLLPLQKSRESEPRGRLGGSWERRLLSFWPGGLASDLGNGDGCLMFILVRGAISSHPKINKQNTCLKGLKESWENPWCLSHHWARQRKLHTGEKLLDFSESGSSATVSAFLVWQMWWSMAHNHQCLLPTEKVNGQHEYILKNSLKNNVSLVTVLPQAQRPRINTLSLYRDFLKSRLNTYRP